VTPNGGTPGSPGGSGSSGSAASGATVGPLDVWKQLAGAVGGLFGGIGTGTGPVQEICDLWKQAATTYFTAVAECLESSWWAGAGPDPDVVKVKVAPASGGAVPLGAQVTDPGLRGLGWGSAIRIAPADVVLSVDTDGTLDATVSFMHVTEDEKKRTIIYQGNVVDNTLPGTVQGGLVTVVKPAFSA
jgi:hypothetical protein